MEPGQPSRTALGAAGLRAAHQVLDHGAIFSDPLAVRILGGDAAQLMRDAEADPWRQRLRWFIAMRSRLAEDALKAAAEQRGVRQLVVLGAGLDTFAYRRVVDGLRVFEVDHPQTQIWKRQRLADASIALPDMLCFVPVDFERDGLSEALAAAGFKAAEPAFFSWLGVVPYLTEEAIFATLGLIGRLPGGAEVVFDYVNPSASRAAPAGSDAIAAETARQALKDRVAELGEPIHSYFETDILCARLAQLGFDGVADFGPEQLAARFFPGRARAGSGGGAHIMHAMAGA
ncbi:MULTISPECIES: SAM-dependent methyltransferase [Rhodopseudomonas]|uniref:S-adenosyl-L-methionine-dependent methyltransferase n=1 Tax=Rhodopseudomonas palustris TaxID=1076 RepID=A0A0D7EHM4_RHOPL|nr:MULTISPECIES: SAM-dependent methyltransferase [Rhodopseudomonas]KIZ40176.1 methyltransferase [Rhodopseudomonas palustris]MDF3811172.1 SAM-dependent methyltransferase [Rhodopseudomonas sp. BAL398]WOK17454.1 SAM-dependent methyltransferase [Rhodopseudomonas sp. BAL398]